MLSHKFLHCKYKLKLFFRLLQNTLTRYFFYRKTFATYKIFRFTKQLVLIVQSFAVVTSRTSSTQQPCARTFPSHCLQIDAQRANTARHLGSARRRRSNEGRQDSRRGRPRSAFRRTLSGKKVGKERGGRGGRRCVFACVCVGSEGGAGSGGVAPTRAWEGGGVLSERVRADRGARFPGESS